MDDNQTQEKFTIDELDTIDNRELFHDLNLTKNQFKIQDVIPEKLSENSKQKDIISSKDQIEKEINENNDNKNNDYYSLNENEIIADDNIQEQNENNIFNDNNEEKESNYNGEENKNYNENELIENKNSEEKLKSDKNNQENIPQSANCMNFKDFMESKKIIPKSTSSNNLDKNKNVKKNIINSIHNNYIKINTTKINNPVKIKKNNIAKIKNNSATTLHPKKKSEHQKYIEQLSQPKKSSNNINLKEEVSKNRSPNTIKRKVKNEDIFRLYEEDKKWKVKKEKMRQEFLEKKMKECSFSPQINELNPKIFSGYSNNKNENTYIINSNQKKNLEISNSINNFTHVPKINKIYRPKRVNTNSLDVYSRLYKTKKNNTCVKCCDYIDNDAINCVFKPNVNYHIDCENDTESFHNFIKRQKMFEKYITEKKINLKNKFNNIQKKKCTFTPNISCTTNSKYSIRLNAKRYDETFLDKINRIRQKEPSYEENYDDFYNDYKEKVNKKKSVRNKPELKYEKNNNYTNYNDYNNNLYNYKIYSKYNNNENYNNYTDCNIKYYNFKKLSDDNKDYNYYNYNIYNNSNNDNNNGYNIYSNNNINNVNNINNINNIYNDNNDDLNINYEIGERDNYYDTKAKYSKRNLSASNLKNNNSNFYSEFFYIGNDVKDGNTNGICTNIAENCKNIKFIINKQKNRQSYNNIHNIIDSKNRCRYLLI